jgi:hypothetical protein
MAIGITISYFAFRHEYIIETLRSSSLSDPNV